MVLRRTISMLISIVLMLLLVGIISSVTVYAGGEMQEFCLVPPDSMHEMICFKTE